MGDQAFRLLSDDGFILDGTQGCLMERVAVPSPRPPAGDPGSAGEAADDLPASTGPDVLTVPVQRLHANPAQPRRRFQEDALRALAASMKRNGVLQPILVRPHRERAGEFEIVAGERRWRAARLAGLAEVPVVVRQLSEREALESALVENLQREELTPLEKAEGYRRLIEEFDRTTEQLAQSLGKSRSHVVNTLRLLSLPPAVQEMLQDGELSAGHARALLNADRPEDVAREVVARGLSVRQTERWAQQGRADGSPEGEPASRRRSRTAVLERSLSAMLGLRIGLAVHADGGGTLTIHYQDLAELDAILRRLQRAPTAPRDGSMTTFPGPVIEHRPEYAATTGAGFAELGA